MSRFRQVEAVVAEEMAKPYAYGSADCFFLGLAMIDGLTDSDLRSLYADAYTTLAGAQRALRRHGFETLAALFASHLPPVPPARARLGDVVILDLDGFEHVGICLGAQFVTKTEAGRSFHELTAVKAAFRI